MSLKSYIVEKFFGAAIEQKVLERLPAASAGNDETQWRRLTGNSDRELPVATWQRQVEVCYWLWKTNPLGNWIIETLTSFVAGKGFTWTAANELVHEILEDFWYDPVNRMDMKLEQKVLELFLFGVQCWPTYVAEQTGRVRLGMIDPARIVQVFTDPENAEIHIGVQIQYLHSAETRTLKVILAGEAETVISAEAKRMRDSWTEGECFYFAINRVSNDPYGTSDLFVLADWLEEYEDYVFTHADKARKQNAFIWDVEIQNADEKTCQEFAKNNPPPRDGSTRVHNEKVKWTAVAPDLKALELKESASVFRNHILGNKSIPEHWYGGGGDVNRNTASESNEPIMALIDRRQNLVKFIIETIFTYAITKALEARYLKVPEDEAYDFAVNKPEATNKDLTKISSSIREIVTAMVAAAGMGWLDSTTAVKMLAFVVALIGFEIDPEAALEEEPEAVDYKKGKTAPEMPEETPEAPTGREKR